MTDEKERVTPYTLYLYPSDIEKLEALADVEHCRTTSEWIRRIIRREFFKHFKEIETKEV